MRGIFLIIPAWLLALLPQLAGGFLKAAMTQGQINRQNWYNRPSQQIQRLMEAGLPFAAFQAGQAGSQSQIADVSGIGDAFSNFNVNRNQVLTADLLKEQIRGAGITADRGFLAQQIEEARADYDLNQGEVIDGVARNNAWIGRRNEQIILNMDRWLKTYQTRIADIEQQVKKDLFDRGKLTEAAEADLNRVLLSNKLAQQTFDNIEKQNAAKNMIIDKMMEGGLGLGEAIIMTIMQSLSGGVSMGGANIGF